MEILGWARTARVIIADHPQKNNIEGLETGIAPIALNILGRGRFNIDRYGSPFPLQKPGNAQRATCHMTGEHREPDMHRLEGSYIFNNKADAERNYDLRDDRYVQRAFGIAAAL